MIKTDDYPKINREISRRNSHDRLQCPTSPMCYGSRAAGQCTWRKKQKQITQHKPENRTKLGRFWTNTGARGCLMISVTSHRWWSPKIYHVHFTGQPTGNLLPINTLHLIRKLWNKNQPDTVSSAVDGKHQPMLKLQYFSRYHSKV